MALWQAWTDLLQGILQTLSVDWRLGGGLAIIILTGVLRGALLPLTWWLAYRAALRQATLAQLVPQLKLIREACAKGFLWVRNPARPDLALAIVAALATAAMMAVAPHAPENTRLLLILVPALLCFMAALHFSSGIALYWITSNLFGTVQTLALRRVLAARAGGPIA